MERGALIRLNYDTADEFIDQFERPHESHMVVNRGRLLAIATRVSSYRDVEEVAEYFAEQGFCLPPLTFLGMAADAFWKNRVKNMKELVEHRNRVHVLNRRDQPRVSIQPLIEGIEGVLASRFDLSDELVHGPVRGARPLEEVARELGITLLDEPTE